MAGVATGQIETEEQQWVTAAFAGDRDGFGKLVSMYQKPVYSMCMRYMKGEEAQDAAQEVFVRAFVNRHRFSADKAVLPWLLTIARNLCIDKLRRGKRETTTDFQNAEPVSDKQNAEQELSQKQTMALVGRQMDALPEGQREAIVLHHIHGLPYKEISDVMNVPQGTVMTWLHRGRKAILQAVKRNESMQGA